MGRGATAPGSDADARRLPDRGLHRTRRAEGVVVRGRVLDDPPPTEAVDGEGVGAALRRTLAGFVTDELPGVPLRITVGDATAETVTDPEGYFVTRLRPDPQALASPWTDGTVELAGEYRGLPRPTRHRCGCGCRERTRFGIVSDVDDTILETGVQRVGQMIRQTLTGSSMTRTPFPGAPGSTATSPEREPGRLRLLEPLEPARVPRGVPAVPRVPDGARAAARPARHARRPRAEARPDPGGPRPASPAPFVLLGDSGEKDPEVYADIVRTNPGRILAVYIREVRLDPGDGRVEKVSDAWSQDVPFVLAADSDAVRRHATGLGLLGTGPDAS